MNVVADVRLSGDGGDELVRHVLGMRCRKTHTDRPVDGSYRRQKVCKVFSIIPVRIHILAEERHFLEPAGDEVLNFTNNAGKRAAPFASARERHDAERAKLVASPHHRNPGADAIGPERNDVVIIFHARQPDRDPFLPRQSSFNKIGQLSIFVGTDDQVDKRLRLHQVLPQAFGHASQNADDNAWIALLEMFEITQSAIDPGFGILADSAGIDKDDIRIGRRRHVSESGTVHDTLHDLRVSTVHLTPLFFEVAFFLFHFERLVNKNSKKLSYCQSGSSSLSSTSKHTV